MANINAEDRPDFPHFIAANEHGFYCIPEEFAPRLVPRVLKKGEVYEPATLGFLCRHCGEGDVITGGAFVGDFLPALARAVAPGACVHSFEPHPLSHRAALFTLKLNGIENVVLHPVAVGAEVDEMQLQVSRGTSGKELAAAARLVTDEHGDAPTIPVRVERLDSLVPPDRPVSLLHLDVEGHEMPALRGAAGILRRWKPILVLEAGPPRRARRLARFLATEFPELGYEPASVMERNLVALPLGG